MSKLHEPRRVWYDTEFHENGETIDLISIGLVAGDGRTYYAQSVAYDLVAALENAWLRENVLAHLTSCPSGQGEGIHRHMLYGRCEHPECPWRNREELRAEVSAFLTHGLPPIMTNDIEGTLQRVELWGYYSAYDHVALAQLFGTMMDLPMGVPMYTRDLKQWAVALGDPELPMQTADLDGPEHYALSDAKWNKRVWEWLTEREAEQRRAQYEDVALGTIRSIGHLLIETPPQVFVGIGEQAEEAVQDAVTQVEEATS